jgi:hypothetical protein
MMIRLTILLLTFSILANGQDSLFVKETCKKINELKDPSDQMAQFNIVSGQLLGYVPTIESIPKENRFNALYAFRYRLNRELKKTCPNFILFNIPMRHRVIDFEDKFTRSEIDSIESVCLELVESKSVYVYVVTIDDFFPDSNIEDFTNRNRDYWGHGENFERGTILICISTANRQIRISTGDTSMKYLTDTESSELNKIMIPYFKKGDYLKGLIKGLNEMEGML